MKSRAVGKRVVRRLPASVRYGVLPPTMETGSEHVVLVGVSRSQLADELEERGYRAQARLIREGAVPNQTLAKVLRPSGLFEVMVSLNRLVSRAAEALARELDADSA